MKIDSGVNDVVPESGPDGFVIGSLSDDEIEKTVCLLRTVWPNGGFTFDYLHWLYRENPGGFAKVYNFWDNGQIVAHYAAIPITAKLFGGQEKGLVSLNTAVHPLHRGKGYFKALAIRTFEDAHAHGVNFVIGVANASSTVLFRKQLRFQLVRPLTVKIGIGSVKRLSAHVDQPDYARSWDEPTLCWRLKRPGANYSALGKCGAISIFGHTGSYGIWATMIELCPVLGIVPQRKFFRWNPLTLWIGLDESCDWSRSLYANLPDRFKPSPLNLVFKDLTGLGRTLDPNKILLSILDFDAF